MTPEQELDRGGKAKAILDSPLYQEAYDNVRKAIFRLIEETPMSETQTAEDLRRCLKLLKDLQLNFEAFMKSGKLASFRLQEAQKRRDNPLRNLFR